MKKLIVAASFFLTLLLGACASVDGPGTGSQLTVTHPSPEMEMTKSACCLKPTK